MQWSEMKHGRNTLIFASIIGMMAALFVSRAALSITMMLFVAATVVHKDFLQQLSAYFKNPFLLGVSLLFSIPFASGLWSSDMDEWSDIVRIKLPLIFLPIAFAGSWQLQRRQWLWAAYVFIALLVSAVLWSLLGYVQNMEAINEGYLRAKVITTPLQNDHVRYSWLVSVGALLCLLLIESTKILKTLLAIALVLFVVYLHILAARTGLISLYIIFFGYAVWFMIKRKNKMLTISVIAVIILLPLLAWLVLPTFQNRVKYLVYDHSFIKNNTYLPGGNDGNRMLSYKAGWHILKTAPFGVGAGDTFAAASEWYNDNVPNMQEVDKLYPASEWMLYGGAAGWPGIILLTISMLLPLFYRPHNKSIFWLLLNATAAFSLMFDIGLEVQYGVFVYTFLVLWWWKWFSAPQQIEVHE